MNRMKINVGLGVIIFCVAAMPNKAVVAADVLSFNFGNLDGSFNAGSLLFTASSNAGSNGNVSRLFAPAGDAGFDGSTTNFFGLSMNLSGLTSSTANGVGTLTLTDVNGDKLIGMLNGTWTRNTGALDSATFSGDLSLGVDTSMGNGVFEGQSGSGFSLNFSPLNPPFLGTAVNLEFGNWFTDNAGVPQSFPSSTTLAIGTVVPEPATLVILGLGALGFAARRRYR